MNEKIWEEAMSNMIKRIEALEEKINQKPVIQKQYNKTGEATPGQIKYIRMLGGGVWSGMTKAEAGFEIDKLLKEKEKVTKSHTESPRVTEPTEVDTDDAGIDEEGFI